MRGKDKIARENKGYKIRWLEHQLEKQKQTYDNKIANLNEKHTLFLECLKNALESEYNIKWWKVMRLVRMDMEEEKAEKEMWEELEEREQEKGVITNE
jgi:hypothetical protein